MLDTIDAPAPTKGRERTCNHCRNTYRAIRSTSQFCSDKCRQADQRANSDQGVEAQIAAKTRDLLRRWLLRRSYAGQINQISKRKPSQPIIGLTVPRSHALAEWNQWNPGAAMTDAVFGTSLEKLAIEGFTGRG